MKKKIGFSPVCDARSRILILGSFPSVKSRQIDFYYGNKQNRFWKTVCGFFGETVPESKQEKREFLLRRQIAVWDMVTACDIVGSSDASVKNAELADLEEVFSKAKIEKILLNGSLAYALFLSKYEGIDIPYQKLSSTSPANPRFQKEEWENALYDVFRISQ